MNKVLALSLLVSTVFVASAADALARTKKNDFGAIPVSNKELAEIRGGYLMAGGLLIEFGLTAETIIDGSIHRQIQFGTVPGQQSVSADQLKGVIQIGENNKSIPQEILDALPNVVTVIQNSEDNKVIQNINQLDIQVSNARVFQDGNVSSVITNSTINALQ